MAFRYEIWKFTHPTNDDVFFINNYEKDADVYPNDANFQLSLEKFEEEEFYRVKSSGGLIFSGEEYEYIREISENCDSYLILAFDTSNKTRSTFIKSLFFDKADFIGFIRKRSNVYDYDRCTVTVTPDTLDTYTKLLRGINDKFNVFDIVPRVFVGGIYFEHEIETWSREYISDSLPDPTVNSVISIRPVGTNTLVNEFAGGVRWKMSYSEIENGKYNITELYVREYLINQSQQAPSNFAWESKVDVDGNYTNKGVWVSGRDYNVRDYVISESPTDPLIDSIYTAIDNIDNSTVLPKNDPVWNYYGDVGEKEAFYVSVDNGNYKWVRPVWNKTTPTYTLVDNTHYIDIDADDMKGRKKRGILLSDALFLLRARIEQSSDTGFPSPLVNQSQILNSNVNPLTAGVNKYNKLVLLQQSDVRTNSDSATKFELSMRDILDILSYLNLRWYITEGRKLVVEHLKFFENGGYYDSTKTQSYLYNLPDKDARSVISFKQDEPPRKEVFTFPYSLFEDFKGKDITYSGSCSGDDTKELAYNFTTDVYGLLSNNPVEIENSGAVLLSTYEDRQWYYADGVQVNTYIYLVSEDLGAISGDALSNVSLSLANVHNNFWRHGRPLPSGNLNGSATTFTSVTEQFLRQNVPIKLSYKEINPLKKVNTKIGDSKILQSTYNLKTCLWDTTLQYKEVTYE